MRIFTYFLAFFVFLQFSCENEVSVNLPDGSNLPPDGTTCLRGEGPVVSQSRTIADNFQRLRSFIVADVNITQGPQEDIRLEAQQNILDNINARVVNGELRLEQVRCVNISEIVQIYITMPEIMAITQEGIGDMIAENDFDLPELLVTLDGTGNIQLRGNVDILDVDHDDGVGNVRAFDLVSEVCRVRLAGVGDVEVYVNDELDVTLSGVGDVYFKGDPTIKSSITGTGAVIDAN